MAKGKLVKPRSSAVRQAQSPNQSQGSVVNVDRLARAWAGLQSDQKPPLGTDDADGAGGSTSASGYKRKQPDGAENLENDGSKRAYVNNTVVRLCFGCCRKKRSLTSDSPLPCVCDNS